MSTVPRMQFRPLQGDERDLALEITASLVNPSGEKCEAFGCEAVTHASKFEGWGLFIKGELSGALWLANLGNGVWKILAVALPGRWWNMGLAEWMLGQIVEKARSEDAVVVAMDIVRGELHLGDVLESAGFTMRKSVDDIYPLGIWARDLGPMA